MPPPDLLDKVEAELLVLVESRLQKHGRPLEKAAHEERCVVAWRGLRLLRDQERPGQSAVIFFELTLRPLLEQRVEGDVESVRAALNRISLYLDLGSRFSATH